jgi:hypothetical protein
MNNLNNINTNAANISKATIQFQSVFQLAIQKKKVESSLPKTKLKREENNLKIKKNNNKLQLDDASLVNIPEFMF